jgi:hypothetical protein
MNELEVTWGYALRVWWSLFWRALLFSLVIGFVAGFLVGFFGGLAGMNPKAIPIFSGLAGMIGGIPIGIWVVKVVLQKRFSGYRLALVATN